MNVARRVTVGVCMCAIMLLASAGCAVRGSAGPTSAPEPTLGVVATIDRPGEVTRPIDGYLPSGDEVAQLVAEQYTAINACLTKHGVNGRAGLANPQDLNAYIAGSLSDRVERSDLWGFFAVDTASQYGYRRPPGTPDGLQSSVPADSTPDVTDACFKAGNDVFDGGDPFSYLGYGALPDGGPQLPATDSRYVAAVGKWRACMRDRGFDFTDPIAAIGDARWRTPTATANEIATAVADVDCKVSTNTVGIGAALETAYDQRYITAHLGAVIDFRTKIDGYLRGSS